MYRKREGARCLYERGVFARFRYNDLKEAARGCGGRGPYANSMMGKSGLEVRGGCAADRKTRHDGLMSWLGRERTWKSVVEDVERGDLFGGKAERNVARGSVRSVEVGERRFMPQS